MSAPEPARVEVPVQLRRGLVLVPVRIDGLARELTMILDTGAATVVRSSVAEELGLVHTSNAALVDASGKEIAAAAITLPGIDVGGMHVPNVAAFATELPTFDELCAPIDGVLGVGREPGTGFLDRTAVEFDYAAPRIVLAPSADALTPGGARVRVRHRDVASDGTSVGVTATRAEVELDGQRLWVTLDTGNTGPIDVSPSLFLALGRSFEEPGLVTRHGALSQSAGGVEVGVSYETRLRTLKLGDVELRSVPMTVERPDREIVDPEPDFQVLLGAQLLRNFRLVLDLRAGIARFVPVPGADPSATASGLGFAWREVEGALRVITVVTGGPAERAGVALLDEVVAIGGTPLRPGDSAGQCAARATIDAIGDHELAIRVRRDGVEREVLLRAERVLPAAVEASAALR